MNCGRMADYYILLRFVKFDWLLVIKVLLNQSMEILDASIDLFFYKFLKA